MTGQQKALKAARLAFGTSAFTENHINYRRVGCKRGNTIVTGVGDTWGQAMEFLAKKLEDGPN